MKIDLQQILEFIAVAQYCLRVPDTARYRPSLTVGILRRQRAELSTRTFCLLKQVHFARGGQSTATLGDNRQKCPTSPDPALDCRDFLLGLKCN